MSSKVIKPGIYENIPFDEYLSWPCASKSFLNKMAQKSPLHAMQETKASDAMQFGTMAHCRILEPDKFDSLYAEGPDDKRTLKSWAAWAEKLTGIKQPKRNLAEWAEWANTALNGASLVRPYNMHAVQAILESAQAKKECSALLAAKGITEVSVVWEDKETGALCKARPDKLIPSLGVCVDLKTTADASEDAFNRTVSKLGYHLGAAFYLAGLRANGAEYTKFRHLVVETAAPFESVVYDLDDEWLVLAEFRLKKLLKQYAECKESGVWYGYKDEVISLSPPIYLLNQLEVDIELGGSE